MFRRCAGWQHDSAEDTLAKDLERRFVELEELELEQTVALRA
jgi:hypothetical protein